MVLRKQTAEEACCSQHSSPVPTTSANAEASPFPGKVMEIGSCLEKSGRPEQFKEEKKTLGGWPNLDYETKGKKRCLLCSEFHKDPTLPA